MSEYPEADAYEVQAPNLLGMAGQAAGFINQNNQNKLFASQSAQSKIIAQNTNSDGSINTAGVQSGIANNPTAAANGAGDALAQMHAVNGALLTNTGMGLTQHFTRLNALAGATSALNLQYKGQIPAAAMKQAVLDQYKLGNLQANEGASAMMEVSQDPSQNGLTAAQWTASIGAGLQAITPHYDTMTNGQQTVPIQTNANAPGGASIPTATNAPDSAFLGAPYRYQNAQGQWVNGTNGSYMQSMGIPTRGSFSQGVGGSLAPGAIPTAQPNAVPPPTR